MKILYFVSSLLVILNYPFACVHEAAHGVNLDTPIEGFEAIQYPKPPPLSNIERAFEEQMSRTAIRENMKFLTSHPHEAGTPQDEILGNFMIEEFKKAGADESFMQAVPSFLSYPSGRPRLAVLSAEDQSKVEFEAKLSEDLADSTSDTWFRNHSFNGYAPSGKVIGQFVYANFGGPEDFEILKNLGVSVKGKIVVTRYGKCFRGLKAKNAQDRGAIGLVIYSDPHEDGFHVGPVYPDGPWRPKSSVQRGSIQFNSLCAGDPARAASNDTWERCGYEPHELYPKIPVLPIAWEDALPILKRLNGPTAPAEFVGSLPIPYHLGPSSDFLLLETKNKYEVKNIFNAFAVFHGEHAHTEEEEVLILGNHRDAWVYGAADPHSGTTCLLEVAKGLGKLKKNLQWKPKRTIILASWSGEELGLLGSTAFGEKNEKFLSDKVIAYLNVDVAVSGKKFELYTTATLARLVHDVLGAITDPEDERKTLLSRWNQIHFPLGTGSDFTVFIHNLGIPSMDLRFTADSGSGMATSYGTYHSIYDSFDWMDKYGDPGYFFHEKMSVVWGVIALRLSESELLPFNHLDQAIAIKTYVQTLKHLINKPAHHLLEKSMREYLRVAYLIERAKSIGLWRYDVKSWNRRMASSEREFLYSKGLPLRKWFKHLLHAPGLYLGYAAVVIPGVVQEYENGNDPLLVLKQAGYFSVRVFAVSGHLRDILDEQDLLILDKRLDHSLRGSAFQ